LLPLLPPPPPELDNDVTDEFDDDRDNEGEGEGGYDGTGVDTDDEEEDRGFEDAIDECELDENRVEGSIIESIEDSESIDELRDMFEAGSCEKLDLRMIGDGGTLYASNDG
jgi:hypothetical protein